MARLAQERAPGAPVKIIESGNCGEPGDQRWREDGWGYAGYTQLTAEGYIDLVNLNADSIRPRRAGTASRGAPAAPGLSARAKTLAAGGGR